MKTIKNLLEAAVALIAQPIRNMVNAEDPGTGKTFDFRKMVLGLLGLKEDATQDMVNTAYKTAMATEPDEDDKVIKGKLQKANEELTAATAKLTEKEQLIANEAKAKTEAEAKAKAEKDELVKRAELAEANAANERTAKIKLIVANEVVAGRVTKAEVEAKEKELANTKTAEEFTNAVNALQKLPAKYKTTSQIGVIGKAPESSGASHEYTQMVNESMNKDEKKRDWTFHWNLVSKTEKGKALMAQMKQPEKKA